MLIQQGDVLIEAVPSIPKEAKKYEPTNRGIILAEGEVTGHAHCIAELDNVEVSKKDKDGNIYLKLNKTTTVKHEEHKPVTIPAGTYRVRIVQEYDHLKEEARRVAD